MRVPELMARCRVELLCCVRVIVVNQHTVVSGVDAGVNGFTVRRQAVESCGRSCLLTGVIQVAGTDSRSTEEQPVALVAGAGW